MTEEILVPVFDRFAKAWPLHDVGDAATYGPLADALTTEFAWDAHFAGYSAPAIERRLADGAVGAGARMVLFIVDVEPDKHAPVTAEWWADQCDKLEILAAVQPDPYVYRTRGGYRIVYRLAEPLALVDLSASAQWSVSYLAWLDVLAEIGILADRKCADPWRLFRLPFVERDGVTQCPEVFGDPARVGTWEGEYLAAPTVAPRVARALTAPVAGVAPERVQQAIDLLGEHWAHQPNRNDAHLALAGGLLRAGWAVEDTADFMAAVAEIEQPGNGDLRKRAAAARATAAKIESGAQVKGWPSLEKLLEGDGPAAVARACELLGIQTALPTNTGAVAAFVARAKAAGTTDTSSAESTEPAAVPLDTLVETALRAAKKKLKRSNDLTAKHEGELLELALAGKPLTKDPGEERANALVQVAIAVAREVPPGTTPQQMAEQLMGCAGAYAGDLDQIVELAIAHVAEQRQNPAAGEFAIDSETGRPYGSQDNIVLALGKLGCELAFDQLARRKMLTRNGAEPVVVDDHIAIGLFLEIEREFKFLPRKEYFYDILMNQADQKAYHPVLDYLDALDPWDGTERVERWLIDYAGAPDTPYVRAVSRLVLVAAVRRVRRPGCKFDEMLILESSQGKDKSSALRALCADPAWFSDSLDIGGDTQQIMEQIAGKWIVEAGELKGMSKSDHTSLKSFLARRIDEGRMAYGREPERRPRQCVMIGSTNELEYLEDETGNRRYWPVAVSGFNWRQIEQLRDQIWAEASYLEQSHPEDEYIRLDPSLYAAAAEMQDARRPEDPWVGRIQDWISRETAGAARREHWTLADVAKNAFDIEIKDVPKHTRRLSSALRQAGLKQVKLALNGRPQTRYWVRPEAVSSTRAGGVDRGSRSAADTGPISN